MSVEINVTKRDRIIINPATGEVVPRITRGLPIDKTVDASQENEPPKTSQ